MQTVIKKAPLLFVTWQHLHMLTQQCENYLPVGTFALLQQVRGRAAKRVPALRRIPADPRTTVFPPQSVIAPVYTAGTPCPFALPKGIFCFHASWMH